MKCSAGGAAWPALPTALNQKQSPRRPSSCAANALEAISDMQQRIAIGGHRGHGSNYATPVEGILHPSYRENTLRSCQKAAEAGATFVEFDLQVTKDGVVVLWHDDLVIFTGPDGSPQECKVADLTLAEFKALVTEEEAMEDSESCNGESTGSSPPGTPLLRQFDGVKGCTASKELMPWIVSSDDELPTLDAIFQGLPQNVGLNLEVKMAVPETVAVTPAEEVQRIVGPILACVAKHTGMGATSNRGITFSSFDPDVCIALKAQQSSYPIVFLSGCGLYPHADPRRTSIKEAINMASKAQLAGIVAPASILLANKGMVAEAEAANLAVLTYGRENNEPENVRKQAELGVKGAILDEVELVVSSIKEKSQTVGITKLDVGLAVLPTAVRVGA